LGSVAIRAVMKGIDTRPLASRIWLSRGGSSRGTRCPPRRHPRARREDCWGQLWGRDREGHGDGDGEGPEGEVLASQAPCLSRAIGAGPQPPRVPTWPFGGLVIEAAKKPCSWPSLEPLFTRGVRTFRVHCWLSRMTRWSKPRHPTSPSTPQSGDK
jgi:hypothetical protein